MWRKISLFLILLGNAISLPVLAFAQTQQPPVPTPDYWFGPGFMWSGGSTSFWWICPIMMVVMMLAMMLVPVHVLKAPRLKKTRRLSQNALGDVHGVKKTAAATAYICPMHSDVRQSTPPVNAQNATWRWCRKTHALPCCGTCSVARCTS